jgi:cysteine desulfurase/selenocysteine lyase
MSFDLKATRAEFPLLMLANPPLHYLDNAATSQIHRSALKAMADHDMFQRANIMRGTHRLAEAATAAYEDARARAAHFLNATTPDEIVFTSGTTSALNLVAHSFGESLRRGDEVIISLAEHHSNLVPWQLLRQRAGIVLKFLPVTADGRIDVAALTELLAPSCRLIAVTHCSNVTGAITDVAAIVAAARSVGARVLLDGAQQVQHGPVDVPALDVDFYAFSGHKCYGPNGIGVLWARRELLDSMPPFLAGGGMVGEVTPEGSTFAQPPQRFEAGTPPIAQAVGLGAVLTWLATLPWNDIRHHEQRLLGTLLDGLAEKPDVRILGPVDYETRHPVVSFDLAGLHPHDVCQVLDRHGVALRGGHHCAQPLMRHFGLDGANRASIAMYNSLADIEALLDGLDDAIRVLR